MSPERAALFLMFAALAAVIFLAINRPDVLVEVFSNWE